MAENFYQNAEKLDRLKQVENPAQADIDELISYLASTEYVRYFFNDLSNPAWVNPLYHLGWFHKIPPPLEDENQPGYFSMPFWHEGEYLKRFAGKFPSIVKNVALSLKTDNSRAIRTILESLLGIPVNITAEIVNEFKGWIETPFAKFMMLTHEIGIIMEYLAKGGQVEAALMVLDILLEPIPTKDRFDETKLVASSRHDFYWLNQALQNNLPVLVEANPIGVIDISEKQLVKAIELENDPKIDENAKKRDSYWRMSIDPKSDANYDRDIKDILVNTIISTLNKICEQKPDRGYEIITRYAKSEYSIFRRIAVFVLRTWGEKYPDLLGKVYAIYRQEPIAAGAYEFDRFLEIQFGNLPEFAKKEIVEERKNPDLSRVDGMVIQDPDRFRGETIEEKWQTLKELLELEKLAPLAPYLDGEDKKYYEDLLARHGQPSPRPEEGVVITSWEGPESPIKLDELDKKTINNVVQFLFDYRPVEGKSFGTHSREGLGRTLEADVQARANDYADGANLFMLLDLPFVYHTHYFRGLTNAVKNQQKFELTKVIALSEFIVDQQKDEFQKQEFEEGLPAAKLAVAQLLEELFRVKEPYIDGRLLEESGRIIVKLLQQNEPFSYDEQATGYDPATDSLNSVQGVAMHCLVSYGLYCERKRKKEMGNQGTPIMIPLVKETLTEKMDKTKNPSLTVHSVLGWYFPQFIYLDKVWALENREKIFPIDVEMIKYWQAAWSSYIRFSDVYTNVFPELIGQYQRALEELPMVDKTQGLDRSDEKMASHILKAYLLDMIKLHSEDGLIDLYYQKANDETRSHGNFWLSQLLDAQRPSSQDKVWQKIWDLWQWRIDQATASSDRSLYIEEIGSFSRLLKNVPLDLSELHLVIEKTVKFKINGFETEEVIKYLGKHCEKYPSLAITTLHEIVFSNQTLYLLEDSKSAVEQILNFAMDADDASKEKAVEIINIFGERGDYSWRPLLDKSRK